MDTVIDKDLPISWSVTLDNGDVYYDHDRKTDSGQPSWFELKDFILSNPDRSIYSMKLNLQREEDISYVTSGRDGAGGYFFSKRVSTTLGERGSKENFAIGHLLDEKVHITWYNYQLHALESEIRNESDCGFGLIKND